MMRVPSRQPSSHLQSASGNVILSEKTLVIHFVFKGMRVFLHP